MRLRARCGRLLVFTIAVAWTTSCSNAGVIPPGLLPGDVFRLVFATSTTRDALSTNIGDYNNFVTSAAATIPELAALGASWYAIGSTTSTDALTNIGVSGASVGIYRLDGTLIASGTAGLFSGTIAAPINLDESGKPVSAYVWAGTAPNGHQATAGNVLGSATPRLGYSTRSNSAWISYTITPVVTADTAHPFYAISSAITVPVAVPEPGSIGMMALGVSLLFLSKKKNRQVRLRT